MEETGKRNKPSKESLAYIDDLTGIFNRRYLKRVQKDIEELQDRHVPFSVVMVDIDHFKEINDTYGHIKGDEIIREFAQFIRGTLRATDTVIRYGGDEFICVMANTERKDARQIYMRILERCRVRKFGGLDIMVSAGIASYPTDGEAFEELLQIADEALYDAKRSGRGRIGSIRKKRIELPTNVYVARRPERESLNEFISAADGHARAVIIEGIVGIGKTRLVREVLGGISGREILWSDCLAFFEGISYYPIREIIKYKLKRQGMGIIEEIPLAYRIEIGKLIPEVMEGLRGQVEELGLVVDKYRLYESIRMMIELGNRVKVIVVDNMQWADRDSVESIKYLLRVLREQPVTFLFIYRQEEKTDLLEDFTSSISRDTEVREVILAPLDVMGTREMVRLIIGEEPGRDLLDYVVQGSGGNPLYVEEILKALGDGGYLRVEGEHWAFYGPGLEIIPKSIEDITVRKYQELSKEGKDILEIASMVGSFDIDIIRAVTGYNEGHIIGVLEKIRKLGILREHGERMEFQDELSRTTIYQRYVTGVKARMLHKKISEEIELRYKGRTEEVLEQLAQHFYYAFDWQKGVKYCLEAGDRAKEKYANASALRYYTWAEELLRSHLDQETKKAHIDCLLKKADLFGFTGDNEGAFKNLEQALVEAQEIKDSKLEVESIFRKASIDINIGQFSKAVEEVDRCIKIYEMLGDKKGMGKVLNAMGNTQGFLGDYKKALASYERALVMAREIGDKHFESRLLNNFGLTYMNLAEHQKALAYFEECLKTQGEVKDKYLEGAVLNNIGLIYMNSGWYDKALKNYEQALKIFQEIGNKYGEALALTNIGIIYGNLGEFDKGLKSSEESRRIAQDTENKYCETLALNNLANIHMHRGEYEQALQYFENSLTITKSIKSNEQHFKNLIGLGNLYLLREKYKKAWTTIDKAYSMAKESGSHRNLADALLINADYYLSQADSANLEKTIKQIDDIAPQARSRKFEGEYGLLLGRYYTSQRDYEKADKYLNEALKIFSEMKEQFSIGITHYHLGLLAREQNDPSGFKKHLDESRKIFDDLRAQAWQERLRKALEEKGP